MTEREKLAAELERRAMYLMAARLPANQEPITADLLRRAAAMLRETWQPIETAPVNTEVLLFCPDRGLSNPQRIELGMASHGWRNAVCNNMSFHSWATHWMPLPSPPEPTP